MDRAGRSMLTSGHVGYLNNQLETSRSLNTSAFPACGIIDFDSIVGIVVLLHLSVLKYLRPSGTMANPVRSCYWDLEIVITATDVEKKSGWGA
jgi:hypothetical protein